MNTCFWVRILWGIKNWNKKCKIHVKNSRIGKSLYIRKCAFFCEITKSGKISGSTTLESPKFHMVNLWVGVSKSYLQNFDIFTFWDFMRVQSSNLRFLGPKSVKFEFWTPIKPKIFKISKFCNTFLETPTHRLTIWIFELPSALEPDPCSLYWIFF